MSTELLPIVRTRKLLTDAFYRAHEVQHNLNSQLSPEYPAQGWSFLRAAWREAAEALDTLNWKWWKGNKFGQEPTPEQKKVLWMELVDVLHCLLAHFLTQAYQSGWARDRDQNSICGATLLISATSLAEAFAAKYRRAPADPNSTEPANWVEPLANAIEQFIKYAIDGGKTATLSARFAAMCAYADLSAEQLLTFYFAKQVLNEFRWANGYRDDTYDKQWLYRGKVTDDTDVLVDLVGYMPLNGEKEQSRALFLELQAAYYDHLASKQT